MLSSVSQAIAQALLGSNGAVFPVQDAVETLAAIDRHRVAGFCAKHWLRRGETVARLPAAIEGALRRRELLDRARCRHATQAKHDVLMLFADSGVAVRPLKGASLCDTVYRNSPYRAISDVDVLVSAADFPAVKELIRKHELKFSASCRNRWQTAEESARDRPSEQAQGREAYLAKRTAPIDIHWQVEYTVDGRRWRRDSAELSALSDVELQFLVVLMHACQESTPQIHQLLDLLFLGRSEGLDCEALLAQHLPQFRALPTVAWVLDVLAAVQAAPRGQSAREWEAFVARSLAHWDGMKATGVSTLAEVPTWSGRLKFLAGYLVPNLAYYGSVPALTAWKRHWSHLMRRAFVAERRRPGGR